MLDWLLDDGVCLVAPYVRVGPGLSRNGKRAKSTDFADIGLNCSLRVEYGAYVKRMQNVQGVW